MTDVMVYGCAVDDRGTTLEMWKAGFCDVEHGEDVHVEGIL
jgi:hypothetical protein